MKGLLKNSEEASLKSWRGAERNGRRAEEAGELADEPSIIVFCINEVLHSILIIMIECICIVLLIVIH